VRCYWNDEQHRRSTLKPNAPTLKFDPRFRFTWRKESLQLSWQDVSDDAAIAGIIHACG
jgi:hypothetical protein